MSLKNALLGLLNHRPMTGYDLKKIIDHPSGKKTGSQSLSTYQRRRKNIFKLAK